MIAKTKVNEPLTTRTQIVPKEIRLALTDDEGRSYTGRFNGVRLVTDREGMEVYQTGNGNVVFFDTNTSMYGVLPFPEEDLRYTLCKDSYIKVMAALGIHPVIDLDV